MSTRRIGDVLAVLACIGTVAVAAAVIALLLGHGAGLVVAAMIGASLPLGVLWVWMIIACVRRMAGAGGARLASWLVAMVLFPVCALPYYVIEFRSGGRAARPRVEPGQAVEVRMPGADGRRPPWLSDVAATLSGLVVLAFGLSAGRVFAHIDQAGFNVHYFALFAILVGLTAISVLSMWGWMLADAIGAVAQNRNTSGVIWLVVLAVLQWVFTPTAWLYYILRYRRRHGVPSSA